MPIISKPSTTTHVDHQAIGANHAINDSHKSANKTSVHTNHLLDKDQSPKSPFSMPVAIAITLVIVIVIRESAVIVCQALGFASAGNIVGMIGLFLLLMIIRFSVGVPEWLTSSGNTLLVDSGFAFLPVCAGAGLLIFGLGNELWGIVLTMIISTLIPLWGLAKLSQLWLNDKADVDKSKR
ncbi:CidA/LrgA family protein [Psychrobacter sp.]|uniref:CidA/LrgA family protein n=1 Tax=Psychrobacter sp. TaxID=56811 RepID=UPI0025EE948A|nr:CidA/LrgA family protein [Psychrobacter sp.]